MNYNKTLYHKPITHILHNCSINDIPVFEAMFLVCSLQYLHNGFALWILGQLYARLQELHYHKLHKYRDLVETNPGQKG